MTKAEFKKRINQEKTNIGNWQIRLNKFVPASFILGCYYNQQEMIWKIYETDERGLEGTIYTADGEEEAYDKLYDLVLIHEWLHSDRPTLE